MQTPSLSLTAPRLADRLGIAVSGLCVVHCLLLPALVATLPLWPQAVALHNWFHPVFALILLPTTVAAAVFGYRKHGQKRIAVLLGVGLAAVLLGAGLGHAIPGAAGETAFTLAGSGLLVAGHWRNWRADRCCDEAVACTTHTDHEH